MTTPGELSRRLQKMEYKPLNETKIFIIDDIGKGGPIPYTEEQLERLTAEAITKDPYKPVYVIDIPDTRQHETA